MKYLGIIIFSFILPGMQINHSSAQQIKPATTELKRPIIKQVIDSMGTALVNYYVYPKQAINARQQLVSNFKTGLYSKITTPAELSSRLVSDIYKLIPDRHISIRYMPVSPHQAETVTTETERRADSLTQIQTERERNFKFTEVKILPGNIGYLKFDAFSNNVEAAKPTIAAALIFLSNTSALIIDLRHNGGGNVDMVSQLESYFFKQKTHMNDVVDRTSTDTIRFYADPVKADGLNLSMPIYILNSKRTFSGAEDFSYSMQGSKRAIIIGDTTGGGAHLTRPFSVGNGFTVNIPFARSLSPYTQTDWEGTGVYPDVPTPAANALEKALQVAYKKQMSNTAGTRQYGAIKWQLDKLYTRYHSMPVDSKLLAQYAGNYSAGSIQLFTKEGKLFCRWKTRNNYESELIPITNSVFTWWDDTDFEIEFIKDDSGAYGGFRIFGPDGDLARIKKINSPKG
jgi:hypothetical protein